MNNLLITQNDDLVRARNCRIGDTNIWTIQDDQTREANHEEANG